MTFLAPIWNEKLGYSALNDRQLMASIMQAGVVGSGDMKAAAGSGMQSNIPLGRAAVEGNFVTQQGLYIVQNTATVTVTHEAASITLPRIDQIGVKVYDSIDGGDVSDKAEPIILVGTPTGGATLANRLGAVTSLPKNFMRIADVLVPASAASAASFTYRDRRPWSLGFFSRSRLATKSTSSTVNVAISGTENRAEISVSSEASVEVILAGILQTTTACTVVFTQFTNGIGNVIAEYTFEGAGSYPIYLPSAKTNITSPGSYLLSLSWHTTAGTITLATGAIWTIAETFRSNANNGTT